MAQKVQILLEDDLVGGPAVETLVFGLDGVSYEIDLNEENAAKLRGDLAAWVNSGRKLARSGAAGQRRKPAAGGRTLANQEREWLSANGYPVSLRGRIPAHLKAIYAAAHAA